MEYTKENIRELAESIYDLDAEVYAQLGSSLGRVFNRDREGCVSDMVQLMLRKDSHQLRSELALISNMARTIEDKGTRSMIMTEYNRILKEVIALPTSFASGDILDAKAAGLNALQFKARFGKDNHRIICISRTYGCGGNEIGFMLADKLKINYYDAEIFSAVLKRLQAEQDERIRDSSAYPDKANQEVAFAAPKRMTLRDHVRQFSEKYSNGIEQNMARRGNFFLSAEVTIRDDGNGNIGATAHAYLRQPVEELYVSLYLDRYDESLKKWKQVDYADFEYTAEEYPDGVDDPAIDITFLNQKKGYYYRIRGGFTASDGEKVEGFGPRTDGIWIE